MRFKSLTGLEATAAHSFFFQIKLFGMALISRSKQPVILSRQLFQLLGINLYVKLNEQIAEIAPSMRD